MEFHDLQKTRVSDLREMVKEHFPDETGVVGLKKEAMVDMLAKKLGAPPSTSKQWNTRLVAVAEKLEEAGRQL